MSDLLDEPMVRDLQQGENLPGRPERIEFTFTHGSLVFLTEQDVYKVKRARDYGFFDYTTLGAREHYCHEEVRLNRRTAPDVYLGVVPVFRDDRGYSLTRLGQVVDYAVHMRRLLDDETALAMLDAGELGHDEMRTLALSLARFYRQVGPREPVPGALRTSIAENFEQVRGYAGVYVGARVLGQLQDLQEQWLADRAEPLDSRPCYDGHGDLRLEHAYFLDSGPVVIDCIEFLDRFRIGDPALDVAFLAMDLYKHGREDLAESFLGRFAYESDDYDFFPLIDGYMSYRAFVRAKVACFVAADLSTPTDRAARKAREAGELFDLSLRFMTNRRRAPRLIAVGGIIASGKSTLAQALAPLVPATVVSADATRKFLAGIDRERRGDDAHYSSAFTARVHDELLRRAWRVLDGGRAAIVDTTFQNRGLRTRFRELARQVGAPFTMIECQISESVARQRLRARRGGLSDARESLLDAFLDSYQPMTELPAAEYVRLDASKSLDAMLDELRRRLPLSDSHRTSASIEPGRSPSP